MCQRAERILQNWPPVPLPQWTLYMLGLSIDEYQREVDSGINALGSPVSPERLAESREKVRQLREEREKRKRWEEV